MNLRKQDHLATLISSIEVMFKNAENKGIIKNKELYLLNLINKLINYEGINIVSDYNKRLLINFYFRLVARYHKIICRSLPTKTYSYQNHLNNTHIPDECYVASETNKIIYWQSTDINERIEDIIPLITPDYLLSKSSDTETNFEIGVNCNYENIGVVSFFILDALETDTYKIYDIMNNDITHMFLRAFIDPLNGILFVSNNIYSISIINIKIKKTTDIYNAGVFNNIFNTIFN